MDSVSCSCQITGVLGLYFDNVNGGQEVLFKFVSNKKSRRLE